MLAEEWVHADVVSQRGAEGAAVTVVLAQEDLVTEDLVIDPTVIHDVVHADVLGAVGGPCRPRPLP